MDDCCPVPARIVAARKDGDRVVLVLRMEHGDMRLSLDRETWGALLAELLYVESDTTSSH